MKEHFSYTTGEASLTTLSTSLFYFGRKKMLTKVNTCLNKKQIDAWYEPLKITITNNDSFEWLKRKTTDEYDINHAF